MAAFTIYFAGCQKTEFATEPKDVSAKFYEIKNALGPLEQRAYDYVKQTVSPTFIKSFASDIGYPQWDKTIYATVKGKKPTKPTGINNTTLAVDTLLYIPIVASGDSVVGGYILARLTDTVALSYSLAQDYKYYPHTMDNTMETSNSFALKMMHLNRAVFGVDKYEVTDSTLFPLASQQGAKAHLVNLTDANIQNGLNQLQSNTSNSVWVCTETPVLYSICATPSWSGCRPICDVFSAQGCSGRGTQYECGVGTFMLPICTFIWETPSGSPTGGPGGGTGGGGGGTTIPYSYPCPTAAFTSTPSTGNVVNPNCPPPPPGTGWTPVSEPFPFPSLYGLNTVNDFSAIKNFSEWVSSIDSSGLANNPCLMSIYNTLKLDSGFYTIIKNFSGTNPTGYVRMKVGLCSGGAAGTTPSVARNLSTMVFDSTYLPHASKSYMVVTMIHEFLHANFDRILMRMGIDTSYRTTYAHVINVLKTIKRPQDTDHAFMANYYQPFVKQVFMRVDSALGLYPHYYPNTTTVDTSFYTALSWAGLEDMPAFDSLPLITRNKYSSVISREFYNGGGCQ